MSCTKRLAVSIVASLLSAILPGGLSRAAEPVAPDEKAIVNACNAAAWKLYGDLRKEPGNLVISPFSIGTVMAMALSGARGDTEAEMAAALCQTIPRAQIDAAYAKLTARMARWDKGTGVTVSMANALCLTQDRDLVDAAYRNLLSADYRAEVFKARDADAVNAWVSRKTRGKIENILERLDANSVCVLLNAIYFKGSWASRFDKRRTAPGSFRTVAEGVVSVPMMQQTSEFVLAQSEEYTAIRLPYADESLAMIVILPGEKTGLREVEEGLSVEKLQSTLRELESAQPKKVALTLPRFRIAYGAGLQPALESLGMKLTFSNEKADFGGITGRDNALGLIWISQVRHNAVLEVNEEGSEAAAATAVEMATRSVPAVTELRIDRPFLFLLADRSTDAILFLGRVNKPMEASEK